ncbi:hypothetical protein MASR1M45_21530 [Candidatus Kapaibacterium sp.]
MLNLNVKAEQQELSFNEDRIYVKTAFVDGGLQLKEFYLHLWVEHTELKNAQTT